jgi:hypothetical protein
MADTAACGDKEIGCLAWYAVIQVVGCGKRCEKELEKEGARWRRSMVRVSFESPEMGFVGIASIQKVGLSSDKITPMEEESSIESLKRMETRVKE